MGLFRGRAGKNREKAAAGLCIIIVITAAIFIGEGLRDAVEVRLQRR